MMQFFLALILKVVRHFAAKQTDGGFLISAQSRKTVKTINVVIIAISRFLMEYLPLPYACQFQNVIFQEK